MLIVSRREGEKLMIGDDVVISVVEVAGGTVKLGIEAPRSVPVYREELWAAVRAALQQLLKEHQGSRAELAQKLGISERSLYRKLKAQD